MNWGGRHDNLPVNRRCSEGRWRWGSGEQEVGRTIRQRGRNWPSGAPFHHACFWGKAKESGAARPFSGRKLRTSANVSRNTHTWEWAISVIHRTT